MAATIRQASESDVEAIHKTWVEVNDWLCSIGPQMWFPDEITIGTVKKYVERGVLYVAEFQGEICGTFTYEILDPIFWPDIPSGRSAYVHRLVCRRSYAGSGLSSKMLDWVVKRARSEGRDALRLDCGAKRDKLRKVYEKYGFQLVEEKQIGRFYSALYELPLLRTHSQLKLLIFL